MSNAMNTPTTPLNCIENNYTKYTSTSSSSANNFDMYTTSVNIIKDVNELMCSPYAEYSVSDHAITATVSNVSSKDNPKNVKIKNVEVLIPNKVVKVTFNDNTFEKSICHPDDKFDMNVAIGICLAKHLCGGSNKYNNIVNKGIKFYNDKCKAEEEAKKEKERIEAKRKKKHEKKMRNRAKKEKELRDNRIKELAEAIKLAHDMKHTEGI